MSKLLPGNTAFSGSVNITFPLGVLIRVPDSFTVATPILLLSFVSSVELELCIGGAGGRSFPVGTGGGGGRESLVGASVVGGVELSPFPGEFADVVGTSCVLVVCDCRT